jgi:two-component system chemotaxis response regulator CheB
MLVGQLEGNGQEGVTEMTMADSGDPLYLSDDESRLTRLVCPDCHGALAQIDLPHIAYYRCHFGHQWSPQTLVAARAETAEANLWSAVSSLEEQAALCRHLATLDAAPAAADTAAEHRQAAERATELVATLASHLHRKRALQ